MSRQTMTQTDDSTRGVDFGSLGSGAEGFRKRFIDILDQTYLRSSTLHLFTPSIFSPFNKNGPRTMGLDSLFC